MNISTRNLLAKILLKNNPILCSYSHVIPFDLCRTFIFDCLLIIFIRNNIYEDY